MEDPWGYNAWSSTPAHNPIVNDQEHDVSNTLNAPTWNNSGISWNSNDAVAGVDDGWGGSTMFASIGAALGTRDNSSENVNESPVEEKPEAKEEEVVTHDEEDPWGSGQRFAEVQIERQSVIRTPSPPSDDLASIPFSPGLPSTPPVLPHEEHGEEKLDEPVDESDPWGTGTSFLPPASTSSTSPFGIPAVKLDDAFPSQDIGRPFGEEDPAAVEFEPPPPLPTSLDDVPSLSQPIPSIPEPPTDDWGHDTHNAWGPPVSPTNDVEFEDEPEDEWSRAVKQREKQDALVPPEKLSAIVEDAKILFGPPMSPPLPPTSKLRSSKSYASDTTLANDEAEFNWRVAPDELSSRVQTTLDIIQTNPTPSKSSPPPASKSVSVAEDVDPWAARDQGSLSGTTVATPSTSLTLPILPPFPQTSTFKSFQTSLKLTRNTPVSRSSVFSQFITQPTSSQFEKWESSLRMKKELTTEEMDEGTIPQGWRLAVQDDLPAKTTNTKKGGGLFSSLFGGGSSTKPMPGFGSNSPMPPSAATSNRPSVERTGSTPRTSVSVDRTASSSPAPVISPIVTTASSTTPIPSPSKSKPTPAPLPEITGSLFDTPETQTNGSSPTTQEPEQPESGGAVSRFFSRISSKRGSLAPKKRGSMQLSTDDLEFLSDTAGDGSVGRYTDVKDDALFSLSGALESDAKVITPLDPPPPPSIAAASTSSSFIPPFPKPSSVTIPQPPPTKLSIPEAPSLPTLMMGAPGMLASSSSGALATGLGFSIPPAGHLDDGEEDDFGGFGDFEEATTTKPTVVAALEPTLSKSPPPIAENSMMDQFDMLFGGPPAPPSPQRPPAQTSGFKPPPPSSYIPPPAAVTPPVQSKYVPPAHLASAAVPKTKKPIPVARMSSSSSPTTSNPSAFPVVRMSSSGSAKPLAAPGIGNGFSLPPPPGGVKVATSSVGNLLGGLDEDLDFVSSGPSSPANALPPPVPLASSSSSPPPLSPPTNGFTSYSSTASVSSFSTMGSSGLGDSTSNSFGGGLLGSSTSSMTPLAASSSTSSGGGGFDDFDDFMSGGFGVSNSGTAMTPSTSNGGGTLRTPSPPKVPVKKPQPTGLGLGHVRDLSAVMRKGSLPLPPPPVEEKDVGGWGDFGFGNNSGNGNGTTMKTTTTTTSPPIKGFGWTPSNPTPLSASSKSPPPSIPPATTSTIQPPPLPASPISPNARKRADSQRKTLSLVNNAAESKGMRWPAPPSPLPERLSPPPGAPPAVAQGVLTNGEAWGIGLANDGKSSGGMIPVLSPPPGSSRVMSPPLSRGGTPVLPPPPGGVSRILSPPPGQALSPQSTGGSGAGGRDLFGGGGAFGGLMGSPLSKPATPAISSTPAGPGKGGLSAQDLSFFEGL